MAGTSSAGNSAPNGFCILVRSRPSSSVGRSAAGSTRTALSDTSDNCATRADSPAGRWRGTSPSPLASPFRCAPVSAGQCSRHERAEDQAASQMSHRYLTLRPLEWFQSRCACSPSGSTCPWPAVSGRCGSWRAPSIRMDLHAGARMTPSTPGTSSAEVRPQLAGATSRRRRRKTRLGDAVAAVEGDASNDEWFADGDPLPTGDAGDKRPTLKRVDGTGLRGCSARAHRQAHSLSGIRYAVLIQKPSNTLSTTMISDTCFTQ